MDITPGIYIIQNHTHKNYVLDHSLQDQKLGGTRVEWPRDCRKLTLQWCLRPSQVGSSSTYQIQNVGTGRWLNVTHDVLGSMDHATDWDLGSVKSGVGYIKTTGGGRAVTFVKRDEASSALYLGFALDEEYQLWSFEKISDDLEEQPGQSLSVLQPQPSPSDATVQPNEIILGDSNSPYVDDTHFHTDMLFNMPRTPLTRTQRMAALEWARKMGATDIPTMESFDECERALEAQGGSNNQPSAPRDTTNPYGDDAHFHTDMLFNMPRTPFTRAQRAMTLEWLRRLGVRNVPTMKSFDECERTLNGGQSGGNNAGQG